MFIISASGKLRQEDYHELEASIGHLKVQNNLDFTLCVCVCVCVCFLLKDYVLL